LSVDGSTLFIGTSSSIDLEKPESCSGIFKFISYYSEAFKEDFMSGKFSGT
jgi:hypothetical protein